MFPKIILWRWYTQNEGGFFIVYDPNTQEYKGYFVHSKEQLKEVLQELGKFYEAFMNGGEYKLVRDVLASALPDQSPLPRLMLDKEHAYTVKSLGEDLLRLPTKAYVTYPDRWWVCFWRLPTPEGQLRSGAVGYLDDSGLGHICFFFSKEEAVRLARMQKSYRPEVVAEVISEINNSSLPNRSNKKTLVLTGLMATCLNYAQLVYKGEAQVIRK